VPTFDELDRLSSKELHDRASRLAEHRLDVRFFWDLLKDIPAAEAASGAQDEASADIAHASGQVRDFVHADEGKLADALRPVFIDYLLKHG
jgi:hypothetical protein